MAPVFFRSVRYYGSRAENFSAIDLKESFGVTITRMSLPRDDLHS